MKKIVLVMALGLATITAQAQLYLGGSIDFNVSGGKKDNTVNASTTTTKNPTALTFGISPRVGYFVNDKFLVGGKVGFSLAHSASFDSDGAKDFIANSFGWNVTPFARYRCFDVKGLGLWVEGAINVGGQSSKQKIITGSTTTLTDLPYTTTYGVNFYPVITYDLTERIMLEASLNVLGLGYNGSVSKKTETIDLTDTTITDKVFTNSFGLTAGKTSAVSVGVAFKL